jgi:hypothetical protein
LNPSRKSSISASISALLHGLGRLVDVHYHGPLEVGHGTGYAVNAVIVRQGAPIPGDVGEPVEEGVVALLGRGISFVL